MLTISIIVTVYLFNKNTFYNLKRCFLIHSVVIISAIMINTGGLLFTIKVTVLRICATLERIQKIDASIIKISLSFSQILRK